MTDNFRTEKDPLGELQVPSDALYGVQTLRASQNFPISGLRPLPAFVDATVRIKPNDARKVLTGKLKPVVALMTGKVKVEGDLKALGVLQDLAE